MYDPIVHVPLIVRYGASIHHPAQVDDLVSLMDIGPTVLEMAGIEVPTYVEGRSLMPCLRGEPVRPREYVFCEDNYQIMMRRRTHKLVYYIGQEQGELYDLEEDRHELWNRWSDPQYAALKSELLGDLLAWLARSNYWSAGYKRNRQRQYLMRWPGEGHVNLHGRSDVAGPHIDR
jgi:arylsulfatase A-like enzyme